MSPIGYPEFRIDSFQVIFDRVWTDTQNLPDDLVGFPCPDPFHDFVLTDG